MTAETARILLHGVTGRSGTRLEQELAGGLGPQVRFRPLVGGFDRIVVAVSGDDDLIEEARDGLPSGPAQAEAIAVRLRRRGLELQWSEPRRMAGVPELLRLCEERGRSSVEMLRADTSLVTELQLGGWFDAGWRMRLARRWAPRAGRVAARSRRSSSALLTVAGDHAFWHGVRAAATDREWRRLTRSSYAMLVYHRLAGELKAGQERIDLAPERFERQLRTLNRLGFRHLRAEEILAFHEEPDAILPPRSFVVTFDDGLLDCLTPLRRHDSMGPQLFVSTKEVGGRAHWLDDEPVVSWDDLRMLASSGVGVGSHAMTHRRLRGLASIDLAAELEGSLSQLREQLEHPLAVVAYPHGDHDLVVLRTAEQAGFRAGLTTEKGRNGAGTDRFCLRRVSVHGADGALAILWKVVTGEGLPSFWLRLRQLARRRERA